MRILRFAKRLPAKTIKLILCVFRLMFITCLMKVSVYPLIIIGWKEPKNRTAEIIIINNSYTYKRNTWYTWIRITKFTSSLLKSILLLFCQIPYARVRYMRVFIAIILRKWETAGCVPRIWVIFRALSTT